MDEDISRLWQFTAQQSDDIVKRDLELIHEPCGTLICDIEASDSLGILVSTALDHICPPDNDDSDTGDENAGKAPGNCPNCGGEREWSGKPGIATCYFCGQSDG